MAIYRILCRMPIDFRKNANLLAVLEASAVEKRPTPDDPYVVDGYELHAHPNLVERLKQFSLALRDVEFNYVFGVAALTASNGKAFAVVGGTHSLYLLLPPDSTWGDPYPEFGKPWRERAAWRTGRQNTNQDDADLTAALEAALSFALSNQ